MGDREHGVAEAAAVLGEVVRGHQRDGSGAGVVARQQQRRDDAHGARSARGAVRDLLSHVGEELARGVAQGVSLLRDGEGGHLQLRALEVAHELLIVFRALGIAKQGAGGTREDALVKGTVLVHNHLQDIAVVGAVDLVHGKGLEGLDHHHAAVHAARIDDVLRHLRVEGAVEIAAAKVDPAGLLDAGLSRCLHVCLGQAHAHGRQLLRAILPMLE